jgi:hypothetical protein
MNNYYSGQGSMYTAKRDPATGAPLGFIPVGNVPEVSIDIEVSKFEHKESESGGRLLDLTLVKEKKGKFSMKMENVSLENLAIGLYGESSVVASGTVAVGSPELVKVPKIATAGMRFALKHPSVAAVVVKDATGVTTYTVDDDYTVDPTNGVITLVSGGEILADAAAIVAPATMMDIQVSYTYGTYTNLEAFTQAVSPERWLRFEGLNTVDGAHVIIDCYRAQFDPLTGYGLINEDIAVIDMAGSLLADPFITTGSKFFRQRNIAA